MPEARVGHHHYAQFPYHHPSRHVSNGAPKQAAAAPEGSSVTASGSAETRAAKEKMDSAVAEGMNDQDRALVAFENALRHNPTSVLGLNAVASIARGRDDFDKAIDYFQRILTNNPENGEVWGSMGHCLLMKDDLPKAYTSYQQALYHLANPKEPKLWYGIGILYDRYGSFEHAEEAFSSVLKVDPNFEKANEIYFRLGIIYKHQRKYKSSLECFRYILNNPPRPLTSWDIWFQLGHVYEQDRDFEAAKDAYNRVLTHQPEHAKVLQQLGWLYNQPGASFADQDKAVAYLTKSLETDPTDAQSWYLLGRAYMSAQRYNKAYEAYQQAVYRDGRNPTFWCSIGVLYYQISQYRDALDAYSRAIRLNPYISEVWYNLGSLYESCNNQMADALDAYSRALELDPNNNVIKQRMLLLQNPNSGPLPPAPAPVDVHPSQYSATPTAQQPPAASPSSQTRTLPADAPAGGRDLPPPPPGGDIARGHSPGPFRNGVAPPPLNHVDESRGPVTLARMETEPRIDLREERYGRYDPTIDGPYRRHAGSPGSPHLRRVDSGFAGQPAYGLPPNTYASREREEWDTSRVDPRASGLVGPSPRMSDRVIDPRMLPEGYPHPGYYDPRGPYPPSGGANMPGRFDIRRDEEQTIITSARNISPVPSAAGGKNGRKRERGDSIRRTKDKDEKEKPASGKKRGKATGLKASAGEEVNGSPKRTNGSSPTVGASQPPIKSNLPPAASAITPATAPVPPTVASRTVDEDYDEGAADALMTLAGTNASAPVMVSPIVEKSTPLNPPSPTPPTTAMNINTFAGNKRPGETASPDQPYKRVKAEKSQSPSESTGGKNAKRTVIEVLNAPSIASPLPRPASAAEPAPTVASVAPAINEKEVKEDENMEVDELAENDETPPFVETSVPHAETKSDTASAHLSKPVSPAPALASEAVQSNSRPSTPPLPYMPPIPLPASADDSPALATKEVPTTPPLPPTLATEDKALTSLAPTEPQMEPTNDVTMTEPQAQRESNGDEESAAEPASAA
nr:general transcriptional repressor [Cryptococcus depauperatus CBS 7841]